MHFSYESKTVHDIEHKVIGTSELNNGIVDETSLFNTYSKLFFFAFQMTLHKERLSPLRMSQVDAS